MPRIIKTLSRFVGGIADYDREGIPDSHAFSRGVDFRSNPQNLTLLPKAVKESGSVYQGLPKWAEVYNANLTSYIYDNVGNLYSRTSVGVHTFLILMVMVRFTLRRMISYIMQEIKLLVDMAL